MKVETGVSRADFAKVVAAASVVGVSAPALALGDSPRQNLFGVLGWGGKGTDGVGGGGMSSPYSETPTYSPYSPYSATGLDTAAYKGVNDEMTKNYIAVLKDCQRRFEKIPNYLAKKQWSEVTTELTRKAYVLRASMNALSAKSPDGAKAAKAYYRDLEEITVAAQRKQGDKAQAAYTKSVDDLNAFLAKL
jgi:hypothetical protein